MTILVDCSLLASVRVTLVAHLVLAMLKAADIFFFGEARRGLLEWMPDFLLPLFCRVFAYVFLICFLNQPVYLVLIII